MKNFILLTVFMTILSGCCSKNLPPVKPVDEVDIQRFMGDWYVIACIPTYIEKDAFNAVENYQLNDDGTIATTFTFRKAAFDGPLKTYRPKGFVKENTGNALWGMQFIWPIKSDYRIAYLSNDYSVTVIARNRRDYVWIMSRKPQMDNLELQKLTNFISELGYDISKLRIVPQKWQ